MEAAGGGAERRRNRGKQEQTATIPGRREEGMQRNGKDGKRKRQDCQDSEERD